MVILNSKEKKYSVVCLYVCVRQWVGPVGCEGNVVGRSWTWPSPGILR